MDTNSPVKSPDTDLLQSVVDTLTEVCAVLTEVQQTVTLTSERVAQIERVVADAAPLLNSGPAKALRRSRAVADMLTGGASNRGR